MARRGGQTRIIRERVVGANGQFSRVLESIFPRARGERRILEWAFIRHKANENAIGGLV